MHEKGVARMKSVLATLFVFLLVSSSLADTRTPESEMLSKLQRLVRSTGEEVDDLLRFYRDSLGDYLAKSFPGDVKVGSLPELFSSASLNESLLNRLDQSVFELRSLLEDMQYDLEDLQRLERNALETERTTDTLYLEAETLRIVYQTIDRVSIEKRAHALDDRFNEMCRARDIHNANPPDPEDHAATDAYKAASIRGNALIASLTSEMKELTREEGRYNDLHNQWEEKWNEYVRFRRRLEFEQMTLRSAKESFHEKWQRAASIYDGTEQGLVFAWSYGRLLLLKKRDSGAGQTVTYSVPNRRTKVPEGLARQPDGSFLPKTGFQWANPDDPASMKVVPSTGTRHKTHDNVQWADGGRIKPADGYRWSSPNPVASDDYSVEPLPNIPFGSDISDRMELVHESEARRRSIRARTGEEILAFKRPSERAAGRRQGKSAHLYAIPVPVPKVLDKNYIKISVDDPDWNKKLQPVVKVTNELIYAGRKKLREEGDNLLASWRGKLTASIFRNNSAYRFFKTLKKQLRMLKRGYGDNVILMEQVVMGDVKSTVHQSVHGGGDDVEYKQRREQNMIQFKRKSNELIKDCVSAGHDGSLSYKRDSYPGGSRQNDHIIGKKPVHVDAIKLNRLMRLR